MNEGLKSARDLAMERTEKLHQEEKEHYTPLTAEQKSRIAEIEREYKAKIAEKEVLLEAKIKQILLQGSTAEAREAIAALKAQFEKEKHSLIEERERQILAIRQANP